MKKKVVLIAILLNLVLVIVAFTSGWQISLSHVNISYAECLNIYRKFLSTNGVANIDNKNYTLNQLLHEYGSTLDKTILQYGLFDMNGDGLPELHIRSQFFYYIFSCKDGKLLMWSDNFCLYDEPLINHAMLYTRLGGAPAHIDYKYIIMDFYGNVVQEVDFSKYDENDNGIYDDNDIYTFSGINISKKDWDTLTAQYLSIATAGMRWNDYSNQLAF